MEKMSNSKPRVTMNDVAERADVSPATVSFVFSGNGRVSEETARRVLQAADELQYRPPRHRRQASVERNYQIPAGRGSHNPDPTIDLDEEIDLVRLEYDARRQEGYSVDQFEEIVQALIEGDPTLQDVQILYRRLETSTLRPDYPYNEPNDWDAIIKSIQPLNESRIFFTRDGLFEKIYGGWLGRCAGCVLGRAVEDLEEVENTYETVEAYLRLGNAYPLTDYVPEIISYPGAFSHSPRPTNTLRGHIHGTPRDDDLDFTLLNLIALETYGADLSSHQIAQTWLLRIPYNLVYTAEHTAYRNLVNHYGPPDSALFRNPFREYIGAQIRADMFGYTAPGQPQTAALRAYQDGRMSHTKNGIYGEMMVAAMIAAAFDAPDVETIIQTGLSVIPPQSRMAEAVRAVMQAVQVQHLDWYDGIVMVNQYCADYHWVHVLPNIMIVVHALLQSQGDFEKAITIAVMSGKDTDCNGATVGSILGVFNGATALPGKWIAPLNDRLESAVAHEGDNAISELARRTLKLTVDFMGV